MMPGRLREQWARSWWIICWGAFSAAFGANIVPAVLRVNEWGEAEWTLFGVIVVGAVFIDRFAIPRIKNPSYVPWLFSVPWINKWANRRRARKGLAPLPAREPGHGFRMRRFWNIVTITGGALIVAGAIHVITNDPLSSVLLVAPSAAVVTWFWLRGAEKHASQAAQYGGVSGLVAGVVVGYLVGMLMISVTKQDRGHPELLWAFILESGTLWGILGLVGGMVIDQDLAARSKLALPVSLVAAAAGAFLLEWVFRLPLGAREFFASVLLGAGWGWGVSLSASSDTLRRSVAN